MLHIQDIRKTYVTGELTQTALDGVSLTLRQNEFVAILGPSGSGKTTLLNVIGGLDRYDSGDLIINGISTKKYTDRDWDSYRNHTIGFVFQSYNLIPHQTILSNVELALTISGISRSERRRRAVQALKDVGLGNQLHKKPNQMSGGQMQRVAIARALVNNPSILLADEPTGALDSETSIQVMELLKKVSEDRLVVMVTHNPDLAYQYANRIVRVKDGQIIDDSNPCTPEESPREEPIHKNMGRSSMSLLTALSLSFNNLWTKKGRTLLTSFAGSIGIIGIALIMALSAGFQAYVDSIQEDTLANYPLNIMSETADMASAMASMMARPNGGEPLPEGVVEEQDVISAMYAQVGVNDLSSFKKYLEAHDDQIGHAIKTVSYGYSIRPRLYADDPDQVFQVNPATLYQKITGMDTISDYMNTDAFIEMADDHEMLDTQYEVLRGHWPEAYNELVFVLPAPDRLPDDIAYCVGLKDMAEVEAMMEQAMKGAPIVTDEAHQRWTYDDLMNLTFRLVSVPSLYRSNEAYGVWENMENDEAYMKQLLSESETLKVVGIVAPRDGGKLGTLPAGIAYPASLTRHVIEQAADSEIVRQQLKNDKKDVFSGKLFTQLNAPVKLDFENMITVDGEAISDAFGMEVDEDQIAALLGDYMNQILWSMDVDTTAAQQDFTGTLTEFSRQLLQAYLDTHADETGEAVLWLSDTEATVDSFLHRPEVQEELDALSYSYGLSTDTFRNVYQAMLIGLISGYITEENLQDIQLPSEIAPAPAADLVPPTEEQPGQSEPTLPPTTEETEASTEPAPTQPEPDETQPVLPELPETPTLPEIPSDLSAVLTAEKLETLVDDFIGSQVVGGSAAVMGQLMMQQTVKNNLLYQVSLLDDVLMGYVGSAVQVDQQALQNAFHFNMTQEDLIRLMQTLSTQGQKASADLNLRKLGYSDLDHPTSMSVYMTDFAGKTDFINFLEEYNQKMTEAGQEEKVIRYADMTGMMMESVRIIIDSVSYVLIAFVAVSLIVSSIMIGIITYISVMERTKEIGILRAIGASKHNISQVFNAETFIIGLCSGVIGIGVTLLLLIPGNQLLAALTGNPNIRAVLPLGGSLILVVLSMVLTLLGGLIPSRQASKKDPVIALRSE